MSGVSRVAAVHLEPEPFSTDNGMLTPTNKLAREVAKRKYAKAIADLYSSAPAVSSPSHS
jgi:long-chain acyl-CoA synthetase